MPSNSCNVTGALTPYSVNFIMTLPLKGKNVFIHLHLSQQMRWLSDTKKWFLSFSFFLHSYSFKFNLQIDSVSRINILRHDIIFIKEFRNSKNTCLHLCDRIRVFGIKTKCDIDVKAYRMFDFGILK